MVRARPTIRIFDFSGVELVDEVLRIPFRRHERPRRLDADAHQLVEEHAILRTQAFLNVRRHLPFDRLQLQTCRLRKHTDSEKTQPDNDKARRIGVPPERRAIMASMIAVDKNDGQI